MNLDPDNGEVVNFHTRSPLLLGPMSMGVHDNHALNQNHVVELETISPRYLLHNGEIHWVACQRPNSWRQVLSWWTARETSYSLHTFMPEDRDRNKECMDIMLRQSTSRESRNWLRAGHNEMEI
jgi:hypothetical protein